MDRSTWIALIVLIVASFGFLVIQDSISAPSTPPPTSSSNTADTGANPQSTASLPDTDTSDCQTIANTAAQNDQVSDGETTSVIEADFNQGLGQCYYELDIFTASGNETDLRIAPNDQIIASCTTGSNNALSCENAGGAAITEPQFKALLVKYLGN